MVWPEILYVTHSVVDNIISWLHSRKTQISKILSRLWSTIMLRLWLWRYNFTIWKSNIYIPNSSPAINRKISDENQFYLKFWQIFQCLNQEKVSFFSLSSNRWKLIKNTPTVLPPVLRKRKGGNEVLQVYQWLFTSNAISELTRNFLTWYRSIIV